VQTEGWHFRFCRLAEKNLVPDGLQNTSLQMDGPFAYHDLEECMKLVNDYTDAVPRFSVMASMGHLSFNFEYGHEPLRAGIAEEKPCRYEGATLEF